MAFCTKCGTIMHDDDAATHTCNPLNLPTKGKEKQPSTVEVAK